MTPGARLAAAIEVLDQYLSGTPAEKALTNWARRSRFAGSKDRAAVRDVVFDCLRRRESLIALGGARSGRAMVAAHHFASIGENATLSLFSGEGHAPSKLTEAEIETLSHPSALEDVALYDLPEWIIPRFKAAVDDSAMAIADVLRNRANVFLRVNPRVGTCEDATRLLAEDGIETRPHPKVRTALEVVSNPRRVVQSSTYQSGLVELQDASSQAVCAGLPKAKRMLDYCAGGGGKVLAYGALHDASLYAYDANAIRLRDLPQRAQRAGVHVEIADKPETSARGPYDLVLADVPCSGSGTWRRAPEGKWNLTSAGLGELTELQAQIMDECAALVSAGGCFAYATCSILLEENQDQVTKFLARNTEYELVHQERFLPDANGDGFYVAHLTRASNDL